MTPPDRAPVVVSEEDREAAAQTVPDDGSHSSYMMLDAILEGRADDWPLVQAFARHRQSCASPAAEREEVTRTYIIREWVGGERYARDYEYCDATFGEPADRILALLAKPPTTPPDVSKEGGLHGAESKIGLALAAIDARIADHPEPRSDEDQQYVWGLEYARAALAGVLHGVGDVEGKLREAFNGLEVTKDGYSLRTSYDGEAGDDGSEIVVGGETVVTFADSDEGDRVRMAVLAALGGRL